MKDVKINVHDITRVEGHGNIVLDVQAGEIKELKLEISESPRFYEAFLLGRKWYEAAHITCRICGICSIGHTSASLQAMENALGVEISEQTLLLRKLAFAGETLQSHYLHAFYLVAPDLLGVPSVLPLVKTHPDVVKMALRLKRLANDICCTVAGRHIHPCAMKVKAFPKVPKAEDLLALKQRLLDSVPDLHSTVDLLKTLQLPAFEREMEFVALHHPDEYALYRGAVIRSTVNGDTPIPDYKQQVREKVVPHSHAKHVSSATGPYMVGALARFNINYDQLRPESKEVAEALGLQPVCYNPYMNTIAQVVECVECTLDGVEFIDRLVDMGLHDEDMTVEVKAGRGVGASDVPRGTLFHEYAVDDEGTIVDCNLIIPTGQNLNNIEHDMHALVPQIMDKTEEEIALHLEMLVRAYDPCISCATHLLKVEFV
ncbi:MAG: Ni/Fe hydrogenase subunit alpha [Armatimonadetes bacterium]|nr:Ni/Fe hydrogenase subunit alpha [Armatimonadota bacterium]